MCREFVKYFVTKKKDAHQIEWQIERNTKIITKVKIEKSALQNQTGWIQNRYWDKEQCCKKLLFIYRMILKKYDKNIHIHKNWIAKKKGTKTWFLFFVALLYVCIVLFPSIMDPSDLFLYFILTLSRIMN